PPTLAALLAYFSARGAERHAARERAAGVAQSLETLRAGLGRVEATGSRIEAVVTELRERVARLEGAQATAPGVPG
ncbi:MAG: hypothetical protein ACRD0D_02190, partial [Acidimicrobiales bacterium]